VAFAGALLRVADDADLRTRLGVRARELALERYDITAMFAGYAAALSSPANLLPYNRPHGHNGVKN
jgi:hypothetical protein